MREAYYGRGAIAKQIRQMRALERNGSYREEEWDRDKMGYLWAFNGLDQLFDYVRQLDSGGLVLDIGAGTTKGIAEIAKSKLGQGLNFKATVLFRNPKIENGLGFKNTHITSAAVLRGVDSNSVSAILSLNAIAYTVGLPTVARKLDQVLVPGGVIKTTFRSKVLSTTPRAIEYGFQTHDSFSQTLKSLGYDVAILNEGLQRDLRRPQSAGAHEDVILAIKPGGDVDCIAADLLGRDSAVIDITKTIDGYY